MQRITVVLFAIGIVMYARDGDEAAFSEVITELDTLNAFGIRPAPTVWASGTALLSLNAVWGVAYDQQGCVVSRAKSLSPSMRWRVDHGYQELKQKCGLSHYEGRGRQGECPPRPEARSLPP